ncbi:MAG: hypothetical protein LBC31_04810, partial [Treponema sp.]|nr:hypothetical protein [Treponema sp.]
MKTVFRQSLVVLTLSALGLSLSFMVSVLLFMDSLYYEINARNIRDTARLVLSALPKEQLGAYFGNRAAGVPVPAGTGTPWMAELPAAYRITLIGKDGVVLADSRFPGKTLPNHAARPEVEAALAGKEGSARRSSETAGTELLYAALPVYAPAAYEPAAPELSGAPGVVANNAAGRTEAGGGARLLGVFRLSMETPNFMRRLSGAALPFLFVGAVFFLAALEAVYLFSRSLAVSFSRLVAIAQSVHSGGAFQRAISSPRLVSGVEEFIVLERALKSMASELTSRVEAARTEGRRLEAILNGMSEAVFAMDEKLMLHMVNRQARV